jgi:ribosomal protein S18 acetylase RimI-like enzyme
LDPLLAREGLEVDRCWAAFALADLEVPYSRYATWFCPAGHPQSVALLYRAFTTPLLLFAGPSGPWEDVLDEIDAAIEQSSDVYIVARPDVLPLIRRRYRSLEERFMHRLVLDPRGFRPEASESVSRVDAGDLDSVQRLYAEEPPAFFLPSMLGEGIYYCVREEGEIVALAGTHVLASSVSVAALGNVYTRPDRRGRGLGTKVTSAVTRHLIEMGMSTIVLNVRDGNPARRIYERLGYKPHCGYFEIVAAIRPS